MSRPRLRHWKQRWDPSAELIFSKRMLLNGEQIEAGGPVTDEHKALIGAHRLRVWWEGRRVQISEKLFSPMKHTGSGWYELTMPDGSKRKVRGQEQAKAVLAGKPESKPELIISPERSEQLRAELVENGVA